MSPFLHGVEEELENFFVEPKMTVLDIRKKFESSRLCKDSEISSYKDLFENDAIQNIYIQGNPGMGKSTYCLKLTLDWCKYIAEQQSQRTGEIKSIAGIDFDFLFLVSLRDTSDLCDVKQMITNAIISQMSDMQERLRDDILLSQILDTERCLIILDGLDEWSHPENIFCMKMPKNVPHRCTSGKSVFVTLTRPWKLGHIFLKNSEIDVLLEIQGVKRTKDLITKVMNNLQSPKPTEEFISMTKHLEDLMAIPIITIMLVSVWFENGTINETLCGIYSTMVKMMLRKHVNLVGDNPNLNDEPQRCISTTEWSGTERDILQQLGKLAFEALFPYDKKSPHIVLSNEFVKYRLEEKMQTVGLSTGLLTEHKIRSLNKRSSQFSFLHKTFQEFLAALYIVSHIDEDELVQTVNIYEKDTSDVSQLFIFLCGLNPIKACSISKVLMKNTACLIKKKMLETLWYEIGDPIDELVWKVQNIIQDGYTECLKNGHGNVFFDVNHIRFSKRPTSRILEKELIDNNVCKIETIACTHDDFYKRVLNIINSSAGVIKTLTFHKIEGSLDLHMCVFLQSCVVNRNTHVGLACLDLSSCKHLQFLSVHQTNLTITLDTNELDTCALSNYNISQGNIVTTLEASNKLRAVYMSKCTSRTDNGEIEKTHFNLINSADLYYLKIIQCDIDLSIKSTNLHECSLENYDFSQGSLATALKDARLLTMFELIDCKFKSANDEDSDKYHLDLSQCSRLKTLTIRECDMALSINTESLRECNLAYEDIANLLQVATLLTSLDLIKCKSSVVHSGENETFHLDLRACCNLESLIVRECDIAFSINVTNLYRCELGYYDLSQGNITQVLENATALKYLRFVDCKRNTVADDDDPQIHLNLTACKNLEDIVVINSDICVSLSTRRLFKCILEDYDLSKGNAVETVRNSPKLQWLELIKCKYHDTEEQIDLSACSGLMFLTVRDSDVIVKYKSEIVGRDQTEWSKFNF